MSYTAPEGKASKANNSRTPQRPKFIHAIRNHTSNQLCPEGDEYIPSKFDEAGEMKVDGLGYPQCGRQYRCRTFTVPGRGDKLFMLATECAKMLTYRDSYLLFKKKQISLQDHCHTEREGKSDWTGNPSMLKTLKTDFDGHCAIDVPAIRE
jgi:hypothetical protein